MATLCTKKAISSHSTLLIRPTLLSSYVKQFLASSVYIFFSKELNIVHQSYTVKNSPIFRTIKTTCFFLLLLEFNFLRSNFRNIIFCYIFKIVNSAPPPVATIHLGCLSRLVERWFRMVQLVQPLLSSSLLCRSGRPLGIFSCQLLAKMFGRWRSLTLFLPVFVGKNVCKIKIMVKQEVRTTLSFCIVQHCTVPCCNVLKLYYIQRWTRTNFWLRANAPLVKDLRNMLRIFDPCSRR